MQEINPLESLLVKYEEDKSELIEKKEKRTILIAIIVCAIVVCAIVIGGTFNFSNNKLEKIIETNGYESVIDTKKVEEISKIDLSGVVGNASGYSLVLLGAEDNDQYILALINYSSQKMQLFDYGNYFPVKLIVDNYISKLSEQKQITHLGYIAKYINKYGDNCFENREVAEAYIKDANRFYDVTQVRSLIETSALSRLPNSQKISDFKVIFEGSTAVPLYYAFMTKSFERNSNWGFIDIDSLNSIQIEYLTMNLGPVYVEKETWHAYNRDFKLMDSSFKSDTYEKLRKSLLASHNAVYGSAN